MGAVSFRLTDPNKWNDPWYLRLSRDARDVFSWLCDNCDLAGVIELDEQLIARDVKMKPTEVLKAVEELERPFRGLQRLRRAKKGQEGPLMLWLRNFCKIQAKTEELNFNSLVHRGYMKALWGYREVFPDILTAYKGLEGLLRALKAPQRSKERKGKVRIGERESERERGQLGTENSTYQKIVNAEHVPTMPYESFVRLREMHPRADMDACVDKMILNATGIVGGLTNSVAYLGRILSDSEEAYVQGEEAAKPDRLYDPEGDPDGADAFRWNAGDGLTYEDVMRERWQRGKRGQDVVPPKCRLPKGQKLYAGPTEAGDDDR